MVRKTTIKPAKNKAKEFFNRRRAGIDRKVRNMITTLSNDMKVDVNVTVIYEIEDEVCFFRSHIREKNTRWFSSIGELVSTIRRITHSVSFTQKAASTQAKNTGMGCVDQATLELIKWQESHTSGTPSDLSQSAAHGKIEVTEDILGSTRPSILGRKLNGENLSQDESDGGDSDEDSPDEETETSGTEDDEDSVTNEKPTTRSGGQIPLITMPEDHRPSPKRKRLNEHEHNTAPYQAHPAIYPAYNTYSPGNGQLQIPSQQMQSPEQTTGAGNYSLHTGGPSMALMTQNQNGLELGANDPFGGYDLSIPHNFGGASFQPNQLQDLLPIRAGKVPEILQAKKSKDKKHSKSRPSTRRRRVSDGN
jgi:hypothetical protein